jgi:hypothetical protein
MSKTTFVIISLSFLPQMYKMVEVKGKVCGSHKNIPCKGKLSDRPGYLSRKAC